MKWFKRFLVAVMLLVLLATTTVYLTPLDVYLPDVEQALSRNFNEPVKVRHLRVGALPLPHLEMDEVQLGDKAGAVAQSVRVFFDLKSLFGAQRVIKRLVIEHGSTTQRQLEGIVGWLRSANPDTSPFRVEELQFNDVQVVTPDFVLGPLEGQLKLAADSKLIRAWISMADQKVAALVYPRPDGAFQIDAGLRDWSPPRFPSLVVERMNISGILAGQQFKASKFTADMLGMQLAGSGSLEWRPEWKLAIHLDQGDGELARLLPLLSDHLVATGRLHAQGDVVAHSADVHALQDSLSFDGNLEIQNATVRLPLNAQRPLLVNSAKFHISGTRQRLKFDQLSASLYGGTLQGTAVVQPSAAMLESGVAFNNIAAQQLVEALSNEVMLTGSLSGNAKLSVRMNEFERFPGNVQLNGNFKVKRGVLGKIDLVQAASNPLKGGHKGGQTRFEELSGLLSVDGNGYHLKSLKMSSGALLATGKLDISPKLKLQGLLDTNLKGTATLVSMPLAVSGTVRDPLLRPTGSTLAGAAVGTALLGPGLGTALGIKVGNFLNRLFGAKEEKKSAAGQKSPADQKK